MVTMLTYCDEIRVRTATSLDRISCSAHFRELADFHDISVLSKRAPKTTSYDLSEKIYIVQNNVLLYPCLKK